MKMKNLKFFEMYLFMFVYLCQDIFRNIYNKTFFDHFSYLHFYTYLHFLL